MRRASALRWRATLGSSARISAALCLLAVALPWFEVCAAVQADGGGKDSSSAATVKSRVFNVLSYGAVGDDKTDNTEAFSACLKAVVAAGGGRMVLPDGVYQGRITIPPVSKPLPSWITVEIVGESEPTPVFGTIGSFPLQNNGSIVKSLSTIRITMNRYPTISRRGDVLKAATAN